MAYNHCQSFDQFDHGRRSVATYFVLATSGLDRIANKPSASESARGRRYSRGVIIGGRGSGIDTRMLC